MAEAPERKNIMEKHELFRQPDNIRVEDLHALEGLKPIEDPVFQYLLGLALNGKLPVHWAVVPIRVIHPFDENYQPQNHPVGQIAIEQVIDSWKDKEKPQPPVWLYPSNNCFILSDDYIIYEIV